MADNSYTLHYRNTENVVFPSLKGMERYLQAEQKVWKSFLEFVKLQLKINISAQHRRINVTAEQLSKAIETQIKRLDDRTRFNRSTQGGLNSESLPPPSDTLTGQLILGLWDVGLQTEALAAYVYFVGVNLQGTFQSNGQGRELSDKGQLLVNAAPIVKALPYSRVSTAKLAGAARVADNHVQSLSDEVTKAESANAQHDANLADLLEHQKQEALSANETIRRLNRRRTSRYKKWMKEVHEAAATGFKDAEGKLRLFEVASKQAEDNRVSEFERLQKLFETQLRLRAPVKLWESREIKHSANSTTAMTKFMVAGAIAIAFGILTPFLAGDYIADSFYQRICSIQATTETGESGCERVFSAKGPVTVTGLMLVMSLLMWMARLQYRIHLSERHLALDASEKMAFAETYLAMKEGEDVGKENEAIVLASLFRPTQDGIIRDDESGMDLSTAAILAKQLGRNN